MLRITGGWTAQVFGMKRVFRINTRYGKSDEKLVELCKVCKKLFR